MTETEPKLFGKHKRQDGKPGFSVIVPTAMRYAETDGSDVRVRRVRVYDANGTHTHSYLLDSLGVPFADLTDVPDDPSYLTRLRR